MKRIQRERKAYRAIRRGDFPPPGTLVEWLYWTRHNIRVLWRNLTRPLSKAQREKDMDDLMKGGKE